MPEPEIHPPIFFYRGRRFEAVVGTQGEYRHTFGAAGGFSVQGQPEGKRGIHQLLTLDTRDPVLAGIFPDVPTVPIFYDFHYQSGGLEYQFSDATISITKLNAKFYDEDWPYKGYPAMFPVQPLTLTEPTRCRLSTFERDVWQGIEPRFAKHFIAVVPPSDAYGVNLWTPKDNCDFVSIKCFVDPSTREVVIYNECG